MQRKLTRRAFFGAMLGVTAAAGCSPIIDRLTHEGLPDGLNPPGGNTRHPIAHLLNRATYGPRPGQIEEVERMGHEKWLDEQLNYRRIDDNRLDWRLRRYDSLKLSPVDLLSFEGDADYIAGEVAQATLVRAVFSKRELYEVMVGFWSDHFSIYHFKDKCEFLKTVDDREVIRPHALGTFYDLLRASAHSPAMLFYLDNTVNEKSAPNENYAREIMELHTLGVEGGYTEQDIKEVARCFTGWGMNDAGEFRFRGDWHDNDPKTVLGQRIHNPHDGKQDGEDVIRLLANHPSTQRYVCTKLARRFVADDPPQAIVNAAVQAWQQTDGDIKAIVRAIFTHPDFDNAPPKLKRPFELLASILRATNANYDGDYGLIQRLETMGHRPFNWVTPDGYPDIAAAWQNNLYHYWKLEQDAPQDRLPGTDINLWGIADHVDVDDDDEDMLGFFGRLLLKRDLDATEREALRAFLRENGRLDLKDDDDRNHMQYTLGLLMSSPAFQYR
jgi:uncharacterized protein (DUF1800 family)